MVGPDRRPAACRLGLGGAQEAGAFQAVQRQIQTARVQTDLTLGQRVYPFGDILPVATLTLSTIKSRLPLKRLMSVLCCGIHSYQSLMSEYDNGGTEKTAPDPGGGLPFPRLSPEYAVADRP